MLSFVCEPSTVKDYVVTVGSDNNNPREVLIVFYTEVEKLIRKVQPLTQGHTAEKSL